MVRAPEQGLAQAQVQALDDAEVPDDEEARVGAEDVVAPVLKLPFRQ